MAIFIVSIYLWTSQKKEEELDITAGSKDFSQRYKVEYKLTLYDKEGNEVEQVLLCKEPEVRKIGEDLLEVAIRIEEYDTDIFYFHKKTLQKSQKYFNPTVLSEKYVSYMEEDKLIIHDIFLEGILHEEIIRDFTVTTNPIIDIISYLDRDFLILVYYKGYYEETMEILEIFPNDEKKAEEVYKVGL